MRRVWEFCKKEAVLTIALVLAAVSAFFVRPDAAYAGYIDWQTLGLLFSLMAVMAGLREIGVFARLGGMLLKVVRTTRQLACVLVMLCFFTSMLITNDVALITFVPFALTVLKLAGMDKQVIPVVVLQTIAANLGSMATPIGNPQNLYLYSQSGMAFGPFFLLMLPYTAISLVLLLLCLFVIPKRALDSSALAAEETDRIPAGKVAAYAVLFVLGVLSVAKIVPWTALLVIVLIAVLILDRKVLLKVDYALLVTFAGFFVFIGNLGRIDAFRQVVERLISGREVLLSVAVSQVLSNVPTALLLSGFSNNWPALILGTNLGGLGTLIASMASLISYKLLAKEHPALKGKYLLQFTIYNIGFLIVLAIAYFLL